MSELNVDEESISNTAPEPEEQSNGVITIVFTADNHLGYAAPGQTPRKREERKERLRRAFQQATDFAIGQGVDLFIQGGDLFDTVNPDEQDRSFVAARLAQLRQAGIRTFAVGGLHDTPATGGEKTLAPQLSYARLGALHYFSPRRMAYATSLEPELFDVHGTRVGVAGFSILPGQDGDPLENLVVPDDLEGAAISLLVLHAPLEGLGSGSPLEARSLVKRSNLERQQHFHYVLAGYHHAYKRFQAGRTEVVVAGATQHIDFEGPDDDPGFVFLGLDANGVRWCRHIGVDTLELHRLIIRTDELWPAGSFAAEPISTETIIERLRPLCTPDALVYLRFEGELTRKQYHQLGLNQVRRFGEEHCFDLSIDDSSLVFLPEQTAISAETGERFSPREELISLADEWIAHAEDEQERKALTITKEELLSALDGVRYPASRGGAL